MLYRLLTIIILVLILILIWVDLRHIYVEGLENIDKMTAEEFMEKTDYQNGIPKVEFPFKNILDEKNNRLNIILISAPFRTEQHEKIYEKLKERGLYFCGISSYLDFPKKIHNPFEDKFHETRGHNYAEMVQAWLYCFREIPMELSYLPLLFMTEADLKDTTSYKPDPSIKKEYDFIYVCLDDNDKCDPGWQSYNRNWELGKKCLEVMCSQFRLKGIIVGRNNCKFTDSCTGIVKTLPLMPFHEFQREMQKCRFIFAPNISDASPRVLTEAMCYNMPVLVNYNIVGGWHNVIPEVTGEFFTNEVDIIPALKKILSIDYHPREWYEKNRGHQISGGKLAEFLKKQYPNINSPDIKYAIIP